MATYIDQRDAAITAIQALIAPNGVGAITGQVHQDNEVGQTEDAYLNLFAYDNFGFVIVRTGIDPATGNEVNTAAQNGANLIAAYAAASALTPNGQPLSATNRAAVLVPPGVYSFGAGKMTMNTEFVDIVGLGAPESIVITSQYAVNDGTGTITKTCDNAIIKNVTISNGAIYSGTYTEFDACGFAPQGVYPNEVIDNVIFLSDNNASPYMRLEHQYAGTYKNCTAKNLGAFPFEFFAGATGRFENCYAPTEWGFGYVSFYPFSPILGLNTSGSFVNCQCRSGFGIYPSLPTSGSATGFFKNCKTQNAGFGGGALNNAGSFYNCVAGDDSFGCQNLSDAKFYNCVAGNDSFSVNLASGINQSYYFNCNAGNNSFSGNACSGELINCVAGNDSFISSAANSAKYKKCVAGDNSFNGASVNGEFYSCIGEDNCFGSNNAVVVDGKFYNCVAGSNSFGHGDGAVASGQFYNCRAGVMSFGSNGALGLNTCFASGYFVDCSGGSFSFAGHANAYKSGKLIRCILQGDDASGIAANDEGPLVENGLMEDCTWVVSGAGEPALFVGNVNAVIPPGTQPPKIYGGKYVSGNGSALSIRVANIANPTPDASIVQIRCNATIDGNINNLATAGTLTTEGNFTDYSGL